MAIVTGAARVGSAIAAHLSSLGASLVLGDASEGADAVAAELPRAVAVRADVSDEAAVLSLFDATPHIVVSNAGVIDDKYPTLADTATEDIDRTLAVNARGTFLFLREAANHQQRGGGGRIVAVSSAVVASLPTEHAAYTASKTVVEAMVRTMMAKEVKGTRVTANCVELRATATELLFAGKSEEMVRWYAEANPMGWLGEVSDIVPVVGSSASTPPSGSTGRSSGSTVGMCDVSFMLLLAIFGGNE